MIHAKLGVRGRFKIESVHPETGKVTLLQDWANNTVLTSGMYQMSQRDGWMDACQVGIDETFDPDPGFTAMPGWVAGTTTKQENTTGAQPTAPFYGWRRTRFRFPIGSITENTNINRVGVGWDTQAGDTLVTLAKTVDIDSNPTAITWKADEYLDVTYEFQYHPPTVDATGTVDFNGVTYNYIVRAMDATSDSAWGSRIGQKIQHYTPSNASWLAFNDDIGATIEDVPSGLTASSDNNNGYTIAPLNTKNVFVGMNVGPGTNDVNGWSLTTGLLLRSLQITTTAGSYQVQFDNGGSGVPKTDLLEMSVQFVLSWDEKT